MKNLFLIPTLLVCSACNFSVIMTHTEGSASDVVDETDEIPTKADATINVTPPLSL